MWRRVKVLDRMGRNRPPTHEKGMVNVTPAVLIVVAAMSMMARTTSLGMTNRMDGVVVTSMQRRGLFS